MLVLPAAGRRRTRWRNGLGWTTELHAEPSAADWDWRLSLAESDGPAPFSSFPGVDRELVLVEGAGLRLTSKDGTAVTLRPGESHRFAREQEIVGEPLDGPTRQLNVMWRRERLRAEVMGDGQELSLDEADQLVVHTHSPAARLSIAGDVVELQPGQTAIAKGFAGPTSARTMGDGVIVAARFRTHLL